MLCRALRSLVLWPANLLIPKVTISYTGIEERENRKSKIPLDILFVCPFTNYLPSQKGKTLNFDDVWFLSTQYYP